MKQEGNRYYTTDKDKLLVRKEDQFIMGPDLYLGETDSIKNYEEKSFSDEELEAFYKSVGIDYETYSSTGRGLLD